jgi:small GTP-binding protein
MPDEKFAFDVFLSHSPKDKPAVRELAERLRKDGLRVWFDEWVIQPGDMIGLKVEEGLQTARTLLLVMSPNAFASDWVTLERHTVLFRDPTNKSRRFIPLLLEQADIPDILNQYLYIDWQERGEEQYVRLLAACRPPQQAKKQEAQQTTSLEAKPQPVEILHGHDGGVNGVALSSDGRMAVSGSDDHTVRVWNIETRRCVATLKGHTAEVFSVALTPDGRRAISGSSDRTVQIWNVETGEWVTTLRGHTSAVLSVALSSDGRMAVSGSDDNTVRVWNIETGQCVATLEGHTAEVWSVALTPDGRRAVSGSYDKTVRVWNIETRRCVATLEGHTDFVQGVALSSDGCVAVSSSQDNTVRVWNIETGQCVATLEGHTAEVWSVALTPDGRRAVSNSWDDTVRVWNIETGQCVATLEGHTGLGWDVALTPDGRLAASGSADYTVRVWELPPLEESDMKPPDTKSTQALRYTNAKVLLVGDSGVGKTGLAIRLVEDRYEKTDSTDAAWATQLQLPHEDEREGIEREIWLWDFAGQADYRLIHQLFMDEAALAAFVFNPQSENPFEGLGQWDKDLQRATRRSFTKLLVAGRCDRGGLMVSREAVEQFARERGFAAYLPTSALSGEGCKELREAIIQNIQWQNIPWTSSPRIFKILKENIIQLKDEGKTLLRVGELKQHLEVRLPGETFTMEELRAVVGLLAGPSIVWPLEFGDFVLLQPERINAYAAAVIRKVRAHTDELGYILEEDLLAGRLDYQDMKRLPSEEENTVLRAMHYTLVEHSLCLREPAEAGMLLVFPSYFKRERPDRPEDAAIDCVTYRFSGALDEIYATLVVRLHHTRAFEKDKLWRFAADFKTFGGKSIGLKMTKGSEGAAEITVYSHGDIQDEMKAIFIGYIHDHLKAKAQDFVRERHYVCPHCGTPVENRAAVRRKLERGDRDIRCIDCDELFPLWDIIEEKFASEAFQQQVREMEQEASASIQKESQQLILVSHALSIADEAGQIFREFNKDARGFDGEIEFKNHKGEASGQRVSLLLKAGDVTLTKRESDDKDVFTIQEAGWAEYWREQTSPVMLVRRISDGQIRWMNVTDTLKRQGKNVKQIVFEGEPFTALSVMKLRDRVFADAVRPAEAKATYKFTGNQRKQLQKALESAFPRPASLEMLLQTEMDINLVSVAGNGTYAEIIFNLIQWAQARGRLEELIEKAYRDNPGNPDLERFVTDHLVTRA